MAKILILCITLKDSIERQANIAQQIEALKKAAPDIQVDFQFFDAVYGKKLPPEYIVFLDLSRQFAGQCEHALGPSEFGCYLSHMKIWQRLSQGDYAAYDRVIILEDDVMVNLNHINEKLKSLIHTSPEFAFLSGNTEPSRRRIRGYSSDDGLYFNLAGPKDLYTGAYAYSLTPETAQHFIEKQIKKLTYLDDWTYLLQGKATSPYYYCFEHNDDMESNIAPDRQIFMKKPNRFKKNFRKMKNDVISRIISLFLFKKIVRLASFLSNPKNALKKAEPKKIHQD
jgi:glycosyl transferase family 25